MPRKPNMPIRVKFPKKKKKRKGPNMPIRVHPFGKSPKLKVGIREFKKLFKNIFGK